MHKLFMFELKINVFISYIVYLNISSKLSILKIDSIILIL